MSIKNTIARIIRSDFKQMRGSRSVEETDTLLCHTLSEQFLKADLPLGDRTKVFFNLLAQKLWVAKKF